MKVLITTLLLFSLMTVPVQAESIVVDGFKNFTYQVIMPDFDNYISIHAYQFTDEASFTLISTCPSIQLNDLPVSTDFGPVNGRYWITFRADFSNMQSIVDGSYELTACGLPVDFTQQQREIVGQFIQ